MEGNVKEPTSKPKSFAGITRPRKKFRLPPDEIERCVRTVELALRLRAARDEAVAAIDRLFGEEKVPPPMRDDFEIEDVHPIKVALNASQVEEYELPPLMQAKKSSSNHKKFVDKFGENVWEVEALALETLQEILTEAIDSVLDLEAFNSELDSEREDSHWLGGVRRTVLQAMREAELDLPEDYADDDTEDEE